MKKKNEKTEHTPVRFGKKGRNLVTLSMNQARGRPQLTYWVNGVRKRPLTEARDWDAAQLEAHELSLTLKKGQIDPGELLTLGKLFEMYQVERTPMKGASKQGHDRRVARIFCDLWGESFDVSTLGSREWDQFIRARRNGLLKGFKPAGNRQIQYDLQALRAVLRWATVNRDTGGAYLLERDPSAGLKMPVETAPTRVSISEDDCEALFSVADKVGWRFRLAFVLGFYTGNRIGAIRRLRWKDLDLEAGRIHWPKETDKSGFARECLLHPKAVKALRSARVAQGRDGSIGGWVFPAPKDPSRPCSRNLMKSYWKRAEVRAGLPKVPHRGWHSLRRRAATALKGLSDRDAMHQLGWKSPAMLNVYRQVEESEQQAVVAAMGGRAAVG